MRKLSAEKKIYKLLYIMRKLSAEKKIYKLLYIMRKLSAEKKWKKMEKQEKMISETFAVEKAQLQIMVDFFCYGEIYDELINLNICCNEDINKRGIKDILDNQMSNHVDILKKMSINIQNKFDKLYWDCLAFGLDIKKLKGGIYYIKNDLIDRMTDNKFFNDPEMLFKTLYEILCILKKIENECKILSTELD